jgi:hypothetical protein
LILIPSWLARAMRKGVSPREAPATRGRPRGIPNPRRQVPDIAARPLSAGAFSNLIDRRPHLLRPLAAQLLPPPLPSTDPGKHLAIDLSSLRTAEDVRQMLAAVLAAVARGEIAPPRARASRGGCLPGCARFDASRA